MERMWTENVVVRLIWCAPTGDEDHEYKSLNNGHSQIVLFTFFITHSFRNNFWTAACLIQKRSIDYHYKLPQWHQHKKLATQRTVVHRGGKDTHGSKHHDETNSLLSVIQLERNTMRTNRYHVSHIRRRWGRIVCDVVAVHKTNSNISSFPHSVSVLSLYRVYVCIYFSGTDVLLLAASMRPYSFPVVYTIRRNTHHSHSTATFQVVITILYIHNITHTLDGKVDFPVPHSAAFSRNERWHTRSEWQWKLCC